MGTIKRLAFTAWQNALGLYLADVLSVTKCADGVVRCINVPTM